MSSAGNTSQSGNLNSTPTPDTCGLCWFPGHQAAYCPQRFNSSFFPSSPNSVTRALAALSIGGEGNDSVWYPDSGAISHMTPQDDKLSAILPYSGSSFVVVGNGIK